MKPIISMRTALASPDYFGGLLGGESWAGWRVLLTAICGEPLTAEERAIFSALTGRTASPTEPVSEFWGVVGRRGGKTRAMAVLAAYLSACCDHRHVLAPGERGQCVLMAASVTQAGSAFNFVRGTFWQSKVLAPLVDGITADTVALKSGVDIVVRPASFRTVRGSTMVAALCDEIAFWRSDESRNPDDEIIRAIRPSLATTNGAIIAISSPYARRGALWKTYKRHFGPNGDLRVLVAQAASRVLNPSLPQAVVDRAFEDDPASAAAEFGGEFRSDIEAFISREALDAVVEPGLIERPYQAHHQYRAFVDPSGGSADSFTLAIGHAEGEVAVLDAVRERRPPFSPDDVMADFAGTLKAFGLSRVTGDRYSGEFVREGFRRHGIDYELSDQPKSKLYNEMLPIVNSKRVVLLDLPRLHGQLAALERRTARGGRDSIDHAPGGHDDVANAVAGALVLATGATAAGYYDSSLAWV